MLAIPFCYGSEKPDTMPLSHPGACRLVPVKVFSTPFYGMNKGRTPQSVHPFLFLMRRGERAFFFASGRKAGLETHLLLHLAEALDREI